LRVLFLGGTGFTGPHAVRELVERGHEVVVFHRGEHEAELPQDVRHVHGDLSRWEEHVDDLRSSAPDVVVDMCAYVADEGRRVLDFEGIARRGVVVSSCDVYLAFGRAQGTEPGPLEPVPLTEESPLREVVIDETYDKVAVEHVVQSVPDFPVTVLRYPAVYGPGDPQHRVYGYLRRMDDGRPAILLGETQAVWRWTRGYAEDMGHALALAVEADAHAGRTYHVSWPETRELADWIQLIADVTGWEGRIAVLADSALPEALRFEGIDFRQHYDLDTSRIRDELGYAEVVDERTALERTIEWERANPPDGFEIDYDAEDAVLAALG
jgi:nucleoside-diphosphate-sugar epimerase